MLLSENSDTKFLKMHPYYINYGNRTAKIIAVTSIFVTDWLQIANINANTLHRQEKLHRTNNQCVEKMKAYLRKNILRKGDSVES